VWQLQEFQQRWPSLGIGKIDACLLVHKAESFAECTFPLCDGPISAFAKTITFHMDQKRQVSPSSATSGRAK
jgi:hypothetical protein